MYVMHVAIGGCLTAPKVAYGITEDTGGHIAYVLGAAEAQVGRSDIDRVDIVTRAFDDPDLGSIHARPVQFVGPKLRILRLETDDRRYLSKEALAAERPVLTEAFAALLAGFLFAVLAVRSRSLLYPIILHLVIGLSTDVFSLAYQGLLFP